MTALIEYLTVIILDCISNLSIFIDRVQATFGLVSHIARPIFCGGGEIPISAVQLSLDVYRSLPIQGSPLSCVILRYTCI